MRFSAFCFMIQVVSFQFISETFSYDLQKTTELRATVWYQLNVIKPPPTPAAWADVHSKAVV